LLAPTEAFCERRLLGCFRPAVGPSMQSDGSERSQTTARGTNLVAGRF